MQLNRETSSAKYQITGYTNTSITVNDIEYSDGILIMPDFLGEINSQSFLSAFKHQPDVILLGTGIKLEMPPQFLNSSIGIEMMTTQAACRTYTILVAEHRNVLAILL